jgi:hypothetical protein
MGPTSSLSLDWELKCANRVQRLRLLNRILARSFPRHSNQQLATSDSSRPMSFITLVTILRRAMRFVTSDWTSVLRHCYFLDVVRCVFFQILPQIREREVNLAMSDWSD